MNFKGKKILLTDGYGRQIPSLLRQLHQLGCDVTTINATRLDVGFTSRYPKKKLVVPGIREDMALYRRAILTELKRETYDVLFPVLETATDICTDGVISRKYPDLKIIAAPRKAFLKAYDKQQTMTVCMKNAVPCPDTRMDEEPLEEFLGRVSFPLAAKPRKGSGSAGFKIIHDRSELEKYIAAGEIVPDEYVIQEYISQADYICNCYVMMDDDHNPVYSLVVKTYRWYPIDGGPGCFARTADQPAVRENAVKLLRALDWSGFGQVSFMMDARDNTPKVTEINGRISAGIRIVEYAGCTPVKYLLERAYGEKLIPGKEKIRENLGLRYFHTDIMWFLKNPARWKANPSWFDFRNSVDYIFSWTDPVPFFSYAIGHALTYREDMAKRKH